MEYRRVYLSPDYCTKRKLIKEIDIDNDLLVCMYYSVSRKLTYEYIYYIFDGEIQLLFFLIYMLVSGLLILKHPILRSM